MDTFMNVPQAAMECEGSERYQSLEPLSKFMKSLIVAKTIKVEFKSGQISQKGSDGILDDTSRRIGGEGDRNKVGEPHCPFRDMMHHISFIKYV